MNNSLTRRNCLRVGLTALALFTVDASISIAQTVRKDGEDVVGARWHYELRSGDEKKPLEKGIFRVKDKVIYRGKEKVGVVNASSMKETTLVINGIPAINGKATLRKTDEKPPVWKGKLERKTGGSLDMIVEMRDR